MSMKFQILIIECRRHGSVSKIISIHITGGLVEEGSKFTALFLQLGTYLTLVQC